MGMYNPIITWKNRFTFLPTTCTVTGERIPMFSKAKKKQVDWLIADELISDSYWVSLKGYTFVVSNTDLPNGKD